MPEAVTQDLLLLDTHVWIWTVEGVRERLAATALAEIETARDGDRLLVSAISLWEVATLESRDRIALGQPVGEWISTTLRVSGVRLIQLEADIAVDSTRLPGAPHADPADRILMASARVSGARLVTCDSRIIRYAGAGHLAVLDARP